MRNLILPFTGLAVFGGVLASLNLVPCNSPCPPLPTVYDGEDTGNTMTVDQPKSGGSTLIIDNNKPTWNTTPQDTPDTGTWDYQDTTPSNFDGSGECNESGCSITAQVPTASTSMLGFSPVHTVEPILLSLIRMDEGGDGEDPDADYNNEGGHQINPPWHTNVDPWPMKDWTNTHCDVPNWTDEDNDRPHHHSADDTGDDDSADDTGDDDSADGGQEA